MHITKKSTYKEAMARGKKHGDYFMEWATGEKELKFYPDGEHVCANYLDEVFPYTVDWLKKQLDRVHA